jgi:hypothetical protein
MAKPEGYPLPRHERLDMPYWQINMLLTMTAKNWREFQSGKPMSQIIPAIDQFLEVA